jgi:hypothetical protein
MKRVPNAPYTLIPTLHHPPNLPILLASSISQQPRLIPHALTLQILHASRLRFAVEISRDDDGVAPWPWRDGYFDLGVGAGEGGEGGLEEGVHAPAGAPPVAVVEGEGAAGEEEVADAVLGSFSIDGVSVFEMLLTGHTWAVATVLMADRGMLAAMAAL